MTLATILLNATLVDTSNFTVEGLITDLAFIMILGAITTLIFKMIKQPVVLGYIVAGFLASPNFKYLPSVNTESNIEFWAQIGIVILLFSLGLEFSFKKLVRAGGSAVVTALIIVIGMMCAGFCIGHLMHFSNINSLFLGGMLSMSSTTIIIKAFNDLGIAQKKFAGQVFAVLIVEDLFAVLMMVILSSIAINNSVHGSELLFSIGKLTFFLIIWFTIGVYLLPTLLNYFRRYLNNETLLVVSIGLCLGMAVFSVYCGFSLALGAFVMGSVLAGTSFAERIEHVTVGVKDLFGAVFFISVGMMVNPSVIAEYAVPILILSATVIIGMIFFGTFGMLVSGQSLKVAIESGFSLTQIGEFAFIIATLGMQLGVLDTTIYPIVVAVSVLTTFTTPYFIRMADPVYNFVEQHLPQRFRFLINRYCEACSTQSETGLLWKAVLRRYLWRMTLYCCVLIAISLIGKNILMPWLIESFPTWGRFICTVLTLTVMSPFLLALSYPSSKSRERKILRNAHYKVPLVVMRVFRLIIVLAFVIHVLSSFYSPRFGVIGGIAVFFLITIVFSNRLNKRYRRIETKFINNLNERELRRSGANNNIISNLHQAYTTIGYGSKYIGMRLDETDLRSSHGISIASIQRGEQLIPVPDGKVRLFPGDSLSIIGTEENIQAVLPLLEANTGVNTSNAKASDMKLTSVRLTDKSPLVGKTIANSQLSTKYSALLVSISRGDEFIATPSSLEFKPGDVLWMVANPSIVSSLR